MMRQVDVYLLDFRGRRPYELAEVWAAFRAGRYEYSFSLATEFQPDQAISACEHAYMCQQDVGFKTRTDRQSMSVGDVVVFDGRAYFCAAMGFDEAPSLAEEIAERVQSSWKRWTQEEQP